MHLLAYPLLTGAFVLVVVAYFAIRIQRMRVVSAKMTEIAGYISIGARTYLRRQFITILTIMPIIGAAIYLMFGWLVTLTFVLGVLVSLLTAYVGMTAAIRANVRTADGARQSPIMAFRIAVLGGAIMGLSVPGFSLIALSILYAIFRDPEPLVGFGLGASLAALFAQVGGGIYTKSADVGADLVGKVEKGIPEDDPRNPAVVADLVGDNVGDCAGRGADLFQTFSSDIVTGMVIGTLMIPRYGIGALFYPLALQSTGILSSLAGIAVTRTWRRDMEPATSFNIGLLTNSVLSLVGSFFLIQFLLNDLSIFFAAACGIAITLVASFATRYYAGMTGAPVRRMAEACKRSTALNILTGLSYGLQSPIISIIAIMLGITLSYAVSGGSLLTLVTVNIATDLLIGFIMMSDAFGPISDNAAGIAEMSKAEARTVHSLSKLDAVGNTMKAITKAYAMSSGTITAFTIFATFFQQTRVNVMNVSEPFSLAFLFIGVAVPYLISSLVIGSTTKTAFQMVDEVRRQFREIKGLLEGKAAPDYARCVDIATRNALREMILPGFVSVGTPFFVGLVFGAERLGALLIGIIASAALLGPFFNNLGTALDNAKKAIETRGIKGYEAAEHEAAVVGDTVGDPMKDVAGPSLLILIKLVGMIALLMVSLLH